MTNWEVERQRRIEENKKRMAEMGLLQTVREINSTMVEARQQNRQQRAARKAVEGGRVPGRVPSRVPARRSERVLGKEPTNYNEQALARLGLDDAEEGGRRRHRLLREHKSEEVYTMEHYQLLGSAVQPWELFVDGYDSKGERIYDKVAGQTCHQCRQKTLGKRTACSQCQSLRGVFCGDCLYMRYGENVDEVNGNPEWVCPVCRDLCNCSFHRIKKGWAPTGSMYRSAIAEGFKSVAHCLVLSKLQPEDRLLAAALVPKGWEWPEAAAAPAAAGEAGSSGSAPVEDAEESSQGSAEAEAAAVAEQLLSLGDEEPSAIQPAAAAAPAPRRSGRSGASRQTTLEAAMPRKRKAIDPALGTTPAAAKKLAAGSGAATGALGSAGRGLRSLGRVVAAAVIGMFQ